ncbi:MAG TPA: hypothetical protein VIW67_15875 [Terriglobales bacterium]|jgi:hypothetical protein
MISYVLWYLIITAGFVAAALAVWLMWFRFPDRTINDVTDYLLPVDFEKAEGLLDPQTEAILRKELEPEEFRALQRKRVHLYLALVQRMAHNAAVLIEWANREARTATGSKVEMVTNLQQVGVEVRLYSLLALIKLRFWLLIRVESWRILPAPSLDDMRQVGGVKGLDSYDRLKTAASFLFIEMGQGNFEELLQNL